MPPLSREQRTIVRQLLKGRDTRQVQSLGGYAGTGKSTVLAVLAEALPDCQPCAFTGKAAQVLYRKGVVNARTIHSTIYTAIPLPDGRFYFRRKEPSELTCRGFLVDEASMVGRDIYHDLKSYGLPIIFIGDHGQLEPIASDVNVMADPDYRLETIHRNAGEIAHFAEHLRHGKPARKFKATDRVRVIGADDMTDEMVMEADQVVCAFNRTRVGFNSTMRKLLGLRRLVETGDRIICLRNCREAGLFNGLQGIVTAVNLKQSRFDFIGDDGTPHENVTFDPDVFGQEKPDRSFKPGRGHPFDYAYAVTCHKAQGSEWNRVMVLEQRNTRWDHARWTYTAASRARRRLTWIAAPVRAAISLS